MLQIGSNLRAFKALAVLALLLGAQSNERLARAGETEGQVVPLASPIEKGQKIFSVGHSFHMFIVDIMPELARSAGIEGQVQLGGSALPGSRVIEHWDVPEDKNKTKEALRAGEVDVLTLAPIYLPDDGIEKFADLAVKHNPNVRITIEEFWLPFDLYDPSFTNKPDSVDHDRFTGEELRKMHAPYFQSMDEHIRQLNKKYGKPVLFAVPVGQAIIALREKVIAGEVPGIKKQSELFTDAIGHATPTLQALVAYCHFAVIYRRSSVGLPLGMVPDEKLNRLLQELAWQAVIQHPLSGVETPDKETDRAGS